MAFGDKDKFQIKNLHKSKGYRGTAGVQCQKTNERASFKKLEQKGSVIEHHV